MTGPSALTWVRSDACLAPPAAALRRLHKRSPSFPLYRGLAGRLEEAQHPDDVVRHVLAVLSGYAYSDVRTFAMMLSRLGLPGARVVEVSQVVDAMFICSTAYVVQSADGGVLLVVYRGTRPANPVSWLTDADVGPDPALIDLSATGATTRHTVHAGFYRNVRATRFAVVDLLSRALAGSSILDDAGKRVRRRPAALYLTGHSLGGAMAALMTVMVRTDPAYAPLDAVLRATYTYGQPMIGSQALAESCAPFADRVLRYVHAADVVPQLPPRAAGDFAHFGQEFRCTRPSGPVPPTWVRSRGTLIGQTDVLGLLVGGVSLLTRSVAALRGLPLRQSLVDHGPQNYIAALTPEGVRSEFGG